MRENISPGLTAGIIVVVVVVVAFIGYKFLVPARSKTTPPPEAKAAIEAQQNAMRTLYSQPHGGPLHSPR